MSEMVVFIGVLVVAVFVAAARIVRWVRWW